MIIFVFREEAVFASEKARVLMEFRARRREAAANKKRVAAQWVGGYSPRPLPHHPKPTAGLNIHTYMTAIMICMYVWLPTPPDEQILPKQKIVQNKAEEVHIGSVMCAHAQYMYNTMYVTCAACMEHVIICSMHGTCVTCTKNMCNTFTGVPRQTASYSTAELSGEETYPTKVPPAHRSTQQGSAQQGSAQQGPASPNRVIGPARPRGKEEKDSCSQGEGNGGSLSLSL